MSNKVSFKSTVQIEILKDPSPSSSFSSSSLPPSSGPKVLQAIWPLLYIGKLFGLVPLSRNSCSNSEIHLSLTWKSVSFIFSLFCWSTYAVISGMAIVIFFREIAAIGDPETVSQLLDMAYHCHITITTTFCIYQSYKFPGIFGQWCKLDWALKEIERVDMEAKVNSNGRILAKYCDWVSAIQTRNAYQVQLIRREEAEQRRFLTYAWVLTGTYFGLTLIGAVAYFWVGIQIKEGNLSFTDYIDKVADIYLMGEAIAWWSGYFILVIGPMMEICWAYGDMLIFMFSFVISKEYNRFNQILDNRRNCRLAPFEVEKLRCLHWDFVQVVQITDNALGQITAATFICNILYLFCRVYVGLAEDVSSPNPWIVFEAVYAFGYLVGRIFTSAIVGAKLHALNSKTTKLLVETSFKQVDKTTMLLIERFINQTTSAEVALTGKGYFVLTWSFVGTIVSALITYEVIILQFSISSGPGTAANGTTTSTTSQDLGNCNISLLHS